MPTKRSNPLPDDLPPDVRRFAEYLRSLFEEIGTSTRDYAQRNSISNRALLGFLRGETIPPPQFITTLVSDFLEAQNRPTDVLEIKQAQEMRLKALRASAAVKFEVERLGAELEIANFQKGQAEERLHVVIDLISALRGEADIVRGEARQLESSWHQKAIPAPKKYEVEEYQSEKKALAQQEEQLESQIEELKLQLKEAEEARERAERRCRDLEAAFKEALQRVEIIGGLLGKPDLDLPRSIKAYIDDWRIRWGGIIGLCIGPFILYALPAYLGIIYQLVSPLNATLKVATLTSLIIPAWFGYGIKRLERAGASRFMHLVQVAAVTSVIFLVSTWIPYSMMLPKG
ncbi:hypothetical protein [Nonomuraea dietziae]|uniref:hypothetical protein n=1 Tax=Nonomuraea dietziae TaxID=65515 RepID=UPI003441707E